MWRYLPTPPPLPASFWFLLRALWLILAWSSWRGCNFLRHRMSIISLLRTVAAWTKLVQKLRFAEQTKPHPHSFWKFDMLDARMSQQCWRSHFSFPKPTQHPMGIAMHLSRNPDTYTSGCQKQLQMQLSVLKTDIWTVNCFTNRSQTVYTTHT